MKLKRSTFAALLLGGLYARFLTGAILLIALSSGAL